MAHASSPPRQSVSGIAGDMLPRVLWIFAICAGAGAAINTAKGFYCRDPDTGKLYPANSTWLSTTFCGSYTCMMRKKNLTDTEIKNKVNKQPNFKEENLWKEMTKGTDKLTKDNDKAKAFPISKENITRQDIEAILRISQEHNKKVLQSAEKLDRKKTEGDSGNDQYLSDAEIKTLSIILKNMKKTDLEAILEVYSLAQDIYKEMDKETDKSVVVEALKTIDPKKKGGDKGNSKNKGSKGVKKLSYWYEPLSAPKLKDTDVTVTAAVNVKSAESESKDMNFEGSDILPGIVVANPHIHVHNVIPKPLPKVKEDPVNYFTGSLNTNEFAKLPYYYPITNFQRVASYVNPPVPARYVATTSQKYPPQPVPTSPIPTILPIVHVKPPCQHAHNTLRQPEPPIWYNNLLHRHQNLIQIPHSIHMQAPVENKAVPTANPIALSYPMAYVHYNYSSPNNPYFNGNPWQFFDLKSHKRAHAHKTPYIPPHIGTVYAANVPNAVLMNPEIHEDEQRIEQTPIQDNEIPSLLESIANAVKKPPKEKLFPIWQTGDKNFLKDIKSNIIEKFAPKKMNLERVGKVIKIDEVSRHKRATENVFKDKIEVVEEYEVFLKRSTCVTDTEPGFFRVGNSTLPYPACCPQRIGLPTPLTHPSHQRR